MSLIAVDMTPVLPGGENGGAKILAVELLRSFHRMAPENEFLLLTASWNHEELAILDGPNMRRLCVLRGHAPRPKPAGAKYPGKLRRGFSKLRRYAEGRFKTNLFPGRLLTSRRADLLFCPFTAPTYSESGIPTVSVIHDLQHRDLPHLLSPHEIGLRDAFMSEVSRKADNIICVSEYVRQSVLECLKTGPERTHSVPNCIHLRLSRPESRKIKGIRVNLGIDRRPYMFYPANFWPHKNHRMLLTAYGMFLSRNSNTDMDLVFTGALGEAEKELKAAVRQMGLTERVHLLGFLRQDQLEGVWYGCEFLVFPSLYEGFGIPVLEAMSMGKPVLCSNCTSLTEVAGDAALYFDPRSPREIAQCFESVAHDPSIRSALVDRGHHRAESFRPEAMTSKYLQIFESAMRNPRPLSNGITGVFSDGWTGHEVGIAYGPGAKDRALELQIYAPSWLPGKRVKLILRSGFKNLQKMTIHHGKEIVIHQPLPERQGSLTLTVAPTFRPSEYSDSEDSRNLGVICRGCWLISPGLERTALLNGGGE